MRMVVLDLNLYKFCGCQQDELVRRGKLVPLLNFDSINEHVGDAVELLIDDMFVLLLFNNSPLYFSEV